ncbi:DUF3122 domain-containing protein [Synechococcus sp. BSF8S]|uniref:DUF3122 domain-containing protein n=1 Tax=Synechococcus sp. BSF8S TaxID=2599078 RepID=UPI001C89E4E9|nr:DUF3122 domain-containing protein [Synechococcus sp. BSF8S]MBC1261990.1 DUF3122 domain-containing protein [Synechococcus sp. BSF8S]MBC1264917.1 DUF3122 domain-containing protein [Synechococcus sp. BSA11S]
MTFGVCVQSRLRRWLFAVLPLLLAFLLGAAPVLAADSWSLDDRAGHRLSAQVFEQPFPEYPSGQRIRLNVLDARTTLDHSADLVLSDSTGQEWSLPNRSEEMVPRDGSSVPSGSAQFDLDALIPRPSEALPLRLEVPSTRGVLSFNLSPEQVMELHAMGSATPAAPPA